MSAVGVQADRQPAPHAPLPLVRERGGGIAAKTRKKHTTDVYVVVFDGSSTVSSGVCVPLPQRVQGRTEHLSGTALKGWAGVRSPLRGLLALTPSPASTGAGEGWEE